MIALGAVWLTGWRFVLVPPLVVIGFEMFAKPQTCPWAGRLLILPLACGLSATAGVFITGWCGTGPVAAALSVFFGIVMLRLLRLHLPPALALGLLPLVMPHPTYAYPPAVAIGTSLLALSFLIWRGLAGAPSTPASTPASASAPDTAKPAHR